LYRLKWLSSDRGESTRAFEEAELEVGTRAQPWRLDVTQPAVGRGDAHGGVTAATMRAAAKKPIQPMLANKMTPSLAAYVLMESRPHDGLPRDEQRVDGPAAPCGRCRDCRRGVTAST